MNVIGAKLKPLPKSIGPRLLVTANLQYQRGREALLGISALVKGEDGTVLAHAHEHDINTNGFELSAGDTRSLTTGDVNLIVELGERALDHIETLRDKNKKHDVIFVFDFSIRVFTPKLRIPVVKPLAQVKGPPGAVVAQALAYEASGRTDFYSDVADLWLLSADSGRTFADVVVAVPSFTVTIPASDFLHDFWSEWRRDRFVVFEVPSPDPTIKDPGMKERLIAALDSATNARQKLLAGEWNEVIECLRGVWELVRNQPALKELLAADGYSEEAINALEASFRGQFEFASKFVHREDRGKRLNPELHAQKEDAYLVYSIALSLLNLLARKADRLGH